MSYRIACVQNGDYAAALAASSSGAAETYQGQFATVGALERVIAGAESSLVLAITPKAGRLARHEGTIVSLARGGPKFLPGRMREWLLARRMIAELRAFKPTHLFLRLTDVVGVAVLKWAIAERVPTAMIVASTLDPAREVDRELCTLANADNVSFVANHLRVATESLVACGLRAGKTIEYDVPGGLSPEDFAEKSLPASGQSVLYVGVLSEDKGAGDLLAANRLLRERGRVLPLTVCGDGALAAQFQAEHIAGHLKYLGRVPHDRVVELTREATVTIVPSRPAFKEGLPLTLIESLAIRTPVMASAHPVFLKYFRDGEGVVFFKPGDPAALAEAIERAVGDPARYAALSRATADAWRGARATTKVDELFDRAAKAWGIAG